MVSRLRFTALLFVLILVAGTLQAQNVVTEWNTIATTAIVSRAGKSPGSSAIWFAYMSIAEYDAVNAIRQRYEPFYYQGRAPRGASESAAAVAAAHRILVHYFPQQQAALDQAYYDSLARMTDAPQSKDDGIAAGEASAAAVIAARTSDGLEANVSYVPRTGPGDWQPTPPAFAPALTPWLGSMKPFTMNSASQFLPGPPPSLTSEEWASDYNLVRSFGSKENSVRTPAQTEIGLFWTEHTGQQYARSFGYLAQHYNLDVMDSARLMALLWTGFADTAIGCWNAKYTYGFWRPVTAIRAGGGNPSLAADSSWTPLGTTPNHPEYPAAHGCVTATLSTLIAQYFGTKSVHVVVDSRVFADGVHTHVFEDTGDLDEEVYWTRIYAGFHYPYSLRAGGALGKAVAHHLYATNFRRQHPARSTSSAERIIR